jgi:hypothetical protein
LSQPHIFATRGREQYLLEGIIVALWTVASAGSLACTYFATKIPIPPLRHVLIILSLASFIVFSMQIWIAYIDKTPWYNISDTLPSDLWIWLSSGVKKNSGILKRCYRLSEMYLKEYKDLNSFKKKIEVVLVDYIKKLMNMYFQTTTTK